MRRVLKVQWAHRGQWDHRVTLGLRVLRVRHRLWRGLKALRVLLVLRGVLGRRVLRGQQALLLVLKEQRVLKE